MCLFYNAQLFEITGAAKGVFTHSQSSCHIAKVVLALTAAKSPQRLTRHLATRPAVSFIGGFRTTARYKPHRPDRPSSETLHNSGSQSKLSARYAKNKIAIMRN